MLNRTAFLAKTIFGRSMGVMFCLIAVDDDLTRRNISEIQCSRMWWCVYVCSCECVMCVPLKIIYWMRRSVRDITSECMGELYQRTV